jgi:hypothetical protein
VNDHDQPVCAVDMFSEKATDANSAASSSYAITGVRWTDARFVKNFSHERKLMLLQYAARKLSGNRRIIGGQRCNLT